MTLSIFSYIDLLSIYPLWWSASLDPLPIFNIFSLLVDFEFLKKYKCNMKRRSIYGWIVIRQPSYILDTNSLSEVELANVFSKSAFCLSIYLMALFIEQTFSFDEVKFIKFLMDHAFGIISRTSLPNPKPWRFSL